MHSDQICFHTRIFRRVGEIKQKGGYQSRKYMERNYNYAIEDILFKFRSARDHLSTNSENLNYEQTKTELSRLEEIIIAESKITTSVL